MSDQLKGYFLALKRLKSNSTNIVPKGTKITNDSVSLEAGKNKGAIKKSRAVFSDLILEINKAKKEVNISSKVINETLTLQKNKTSKYKELLDESLAREISLIYEIFELKQELAKLRDNNIINLGKLRTRNN
jgi:predicted nucleic acid-binding protein